MNKTNSAVVLRWSPSTSIAFSEEEKHLLLQKLKLTQIGELLIRSESLRDQDQNKRACLEKLDQILSRAFFVQKKRMKTKPTFASKARKLESKKRRAVVKQARQKVNPHSED